MKKTGFLETKEGRWTVKWSDLQSFAEGTHWMYIPFHPDENIEFKEGQKVEFDLQFVFDGAEGYDLAKNIQPVQENQFISPGVFVKETEINHMPSVSRRNFWHDLKKFFGGTYYEASTDTTYNYAGKLWLFLEQGSYDLKKWLILRYYDIRIFFLKVLIYFER